MIDEHFFCLEDLAAAIAQLEMREKFFALLLREFTVQMTLEKDLEPHVIFRLMHRPVTIRFGLVLEWLGLARHHNVLGIRSRSEDARQTTSAACSTGIQRRDSSPSDALAVVDFMRSLPFPCEPASTGTCMVRASDEVAHEVAQFCSGTMNAGLYGA